MGLATEEIRKRYGADYHVAEVESAEQAIEQLTRVRDDGTTVALMLAGYTP